MRATLKFCGGPEVKQANFAIAVPYPGTEFPWRSTAKKGVRLMTQDFSRISALWIGRHHGGADAHDPSTCRMRDSSVFIPRPGAGFPMLQKHGMIGGSLHAGPCGTSCQKLFAGHGPSSQEQLISLGDGAFGRIQESAMSSQPVGVASTGPSSSAPLLTIVPASRAGAAPARHFGHPTNPNG